MLSTEADQQRVGQDEEVLTPRRAALAFALAFAGLGAAAPYGVRHEAELRRGDEYFVRREYPGALRFYERAARLAPSDYTPHYRIALTTYVWGDAVPQRREDLWKRAEAELEAALALEPVQPDVRLLRGLLLYRAGRVSEARDEFSRLTGRVRQGDPEIWLDLAWVALAANDRPTAGRAYLQAKELLAGRASARAERIAAKLGAPPAAAVSPTNR